MNKAMGTGAHHILLGSGFNLLLQSGACLVQVLGD